MDDFSGSSHFVCSFFPVSCFCRLIPHLTLPIACPSQCPAQEYACLRPCSHSYNDLLSLVQPDFLSVQQKRLGNFDPKNDWSIEQAGSTNCSVSSSKKDGICAQDRVDRRMAHSPTVQQKPEHQVHVPWIPQRAGLVCCICRGPCPESPSTPCVFHRLPLAESGHEDITDTRVTFFERCFIRCSSLSLSPPHATLKYVLLLGALQVDQGMNKMSGKKDGHH
jgi:hypothetical protein